jgi:hypothetical protein
MPSFWKVYRMLPVIRVLNPDEKGHTKTHRVHEDIVVLLFQSGQMRTEYRSEIDQMQNVNNSDNWFPSKSFPFVFAFSYFCDKANCMSEINETNIENNQSELFRPHLKRAKNFVLGTEIPGLYTQIVFFAGICITSIFGIWNTISLSILKIPAYLKQHKQVDVEAIVALRGRELGFDGTTFYNYLEIFHLSSIVIWLCILISFIFVWRKKRWAVVVIILGIIIYAALMLFLLGATYFVDDTTLFDKISLLILFVLVVIQHFVAGKKEQEIEMESK